jgi:outer membrane protein assembly factor BamA
VYDPESWQLDLDELRSSVGFGFSLLHPIPLSFNFGFPTRKGEGDDRETFSFSIAFY